jgi:hypothetical protein
MPGPTNQPFLLAHTPNPPLGPAKVKFPASTEQNKLILAQGRLKTPLSFCQQEPM